MLIKVVNFKIDNTKIEVNNSVLIMLLNQFDLLTMTCVYQFWIKL